MLQQIDIEQFGIELSNSTEVNERLKLAIAMEAAIAATYLNETFPSASAEAFELMRQRLEDCQEYYDARMCALTVSTVEGEVAEVVLGVEVLEELFSDDEEVEEELEEIDDSLEDKLDDFEEEKRKVEREQDVDVDRDAGDRDAEFFEGEEGAEVEGTEEEESQTKVGGLVGGSLFAVGLAGYLVKKRRRALSSEKASVVAT